MSDHKAKLWPMPAKKYTALDGVPMIVIGEENNVFNSAKIQLDNKLGGKIPDGKILDVYVGWED